MKQDLMHKDVNDVNITPEERRSIWQLWRQNLKDWAWYTRENPDWLDLDIQTAVKRHVIAPLRDSWHRLRSLARQKKRREFPESENRLAQLLLFAWGSMPRIGAGLRERFALRRRHNIRRSGSIRGLLERLHLHPAIFLGTCVTAAAVIVLLSVYTIGTTVRYDGINLGTVGSRRTVDQAVQQLETVTRQTLEDQDYAIDTALLSTQTHVVPRRDLESREEFAENLTDQIGDVTYGYTLYVDGEAVAAFFAEHIKGKVNLAVLVNNAGITKDGFLVRMKDDDFDRVITINLRGAFICTREAAKIMTKARHGRIVNISSVVGQMGNAGQANYSAAKAGLLGLTKSCAKELAARQITVNAVAPGFIETDMTAALSDDVRASYEAAIPLKRMGTAQEIADAVAFLASDKAAYITGQVLAVNGGMYC